MVSLGEGGIHADIHSIQTGFRQCRQMCCEQGSVRCERNCLQSGKLFQTAHQHADVSAHQRFSSCYFNMFDPFCTENFYKPLDFVKAQDLFMADKRHALRRHAIPAAQIAPVCNGYSNIVDLSSELVFHCSLFPNATPDANGQLPPKRSRSGQSS